MAIKVSYKYGKQPTPQEWDEITDELNKWESAFLKELARLKKERVTDLAKNHIYKKNPQSPLI